MAIIDPDNKTVEFYCFDCEIAFKRHWQNVELYSEIYQEDSKPNKYRVSGYCPICHYNKVRGSITKENYDLISSSRIES